jgi:hypothetical protein
MAELVGTLTDNPIPDHEPEVWDCNTADEVINATKDQLGEIGTVFDNTHRRWYIVGVALGKRAIITLEQDDSTYKTILYFAEVDYGAWLKLRKQYKEAGALYKQQQAAEQASRDDKWTEKRSKRKS